VNDDQRTQAQQLLSESERHFRLSNHHQAEGARCFNEYRALMALDWDGSVAGEGEA